MMKEVVFVTEIQIGYSWIFSEGKHAFPWYMEKICDSDKKEADILQGEEFYAYIGITRKGKPVFIIPIAVWKKDSYKPCWAEVSFETESRMGKILPLKKIVAWKRIDFTRRTYDRIRKKLNE